MYQVVIVRGSLDFQTIRDLPAYADAELVVAIDGDKARIMKEPYGCVGYPVEIIDLGVTA